MKSKQLLIMFVLAAVLGGAVWFINRNGNQFKTDTGVGKPVIEFPINEVAIVTIQGPQGTVNLARKDQGWMVQERSGFPANFEQISNLLRKLQELKTVQEVKAGPAEFGELGLLEPTATPAVGTGIKVEFKDQAGKALGGLLVGQIHNVKRDMGMGEPIDMPGGRHVVPLGGQYVSLVSDPLEEVKTSPTDWLKKDFFKIENPSSISLAGPNPAHNWKLTRDTIAGEWKLAGATEAEQVDITKTAPLGTSMANPTFSDVLDPGAKPADPAKPADAASDKPTIVTFQTFDGFTYVLTVGQETAGNQPVTVAVSAQLPDERAPGKDEKPEDKKRLDDDFATQQKTLREKLATEKAFEARTFLVAKSTMDLVIKDRTALLVDKPAPGTGAPEAGPDGIVPPGVVPAARPPVTPGVGIPVTPGAAKPPGNGAAAPSLAVPATPNVAKPPRKPVTATTPPVSVPPVNPAIPPATPKPAPPATAPAAPTTPPATPAAPKAKPAPVPENPVPAKE